MAVKTIILISPENTPIVGALLEDGSTCKVIVTYDTVTTNIDTQIDHSGISSFSKNGEEINCIDSSGHQWPISTVIDHSVFNSID